MIDQLFSFSETIRKLGLFKELQPWTEFFSHFKAPREWTKDELEKRVVTNALHYRTNYIIVALVIIVVSLLTSPFLLFVLILSGSFTAYAMVIYQKPIVIQGRAYNTSEKAIACGVVGVMLLLITGQLFKLLGIIMLPLLLVGLHTVFRQRNLKSKFNRMSEETSLKLNRGTGQGDDEDLEGGGVVSSGTSTNVRSSGAMRQRGGH